MDVFHCSDKTVRIIRTVNLYLSFLGLGLTLAMPGPTIIDLRLNANTTDANITFIYTARSCGYVVGSLSAGVIFDRFRKKQVIMGAFLFVGGVASFLTAWCHQLGYLIATMALIGISMGFIDTGGNVLVLDIWGKNCVPFMQALHFHFGLGSFLAPLLAEPFLSPFAQFVKAGNNATNADFHFNHTGGFGSENGYYIINAYSIVAAFMILVSLSFLVTAVINPKDPRRKLSTDIAEMEDTSNNNLSSRNLKIILLALAACFLALFCGVELTSGQMLTMYAVSSDLDLTKSTGTYLTSVYYGTYTAGRALGILIALKFSPFYMIVSDLCVVVSSTVLLSILGNKYVEVLWTGVALLGLGNASIYASFMTWFGASVTITNKIGSLFVVTPSIGELTMPLIVGRLISEHNPIGLMYVLCAGAVGCSTVFFILVHFSKFLAKAKNRAIENGLKKDSSTIEKDTLEPLGQKLVKA